MTNRILVARCTTLTACIVLCTPGCSGTDSSSGAGGSQAFALGGGSAEGGASGGLSAETGGTPQAFGGASSHSTATLTGGSSATAGASSVSRLWSMGYYANWKSSEYPVAAIEWSGMTHVAMAFYTPGSDASLSLTSGNDKLVTDLVSAAHAHGVKAIASLGGAESAAAFRQATASGNIAKFVSNLVALMQTYGYDGLDVDWEPLEKADEAVAIDLATRVRAAQSSAVLTIPVGIINVNLGAALANYAAIAAAYDQMNLMTYGMSGAWSGWKSWHSSPLYQQDSATPTSIDSSVKAYLDAGVPRSKLGIGIGFYGLCYSPPVTGPGQPLNSATLAAGDGAISYANIMESYYSAAARKWDSLARCPYLSFESAQPPDGCGYISYDDEQSIAEKAAYVKANGLGGVIEWEINEGYLGGATVRNPLLSAIAAQVLR